MDVCKKCSKPLSRDETAIYRRLVSRGAVEFLCIECLAEFFKCSAELIHERIAHFKEMGCTLFAQESGEGQ